MTTDERVFQLNVGGTVYEVSDSLLDRFEDSMLRKITSDIWNESQDDDDDQNNEIFIERDGGRFRYVLDYMKDGKVVLPLSVPRTQLLHDMEYYGIDANESHIIPDAIASDDIFLKFSEFLHYKKRFKDILEPRRKELDDRYRVLAAESMSCKVASEFFELLSYSNNVFEAKKIEIRFDDKERYQYSIEELQPHLKEYALKVNELDITLNPYNSAVESVVLKVEIQTTDTGTTEAKGHKVPEDSPKKELKNNQSVEGEKENAVREAIATTRNISPKRIKVNVGGTKYEISNSLLDRFPDSLLRRITSDAPDPDEEIFIERHGGNFKFVLDYMRDGSVVLPLSASRPNLVSDMEYFGIHFDDSQITLSVADPNDMYHFLSDYFFEKEPFETVFESKMRDIEDRYRNLAAENISCAIAFDFFEKQFSGKSFVTFGAKNIYIPLSGRRERFNYSIDELQPFLNIYGLSGFDVEQREKVEVEKVESHYYRKRPNYIELKVEML